MQGNKEYSKSEIGMVLKCVQTITVPLFTVSVTWLDSSLPLFDGSDLNFVTSRR